MNSPGTATAHAVRVVAPLLRFRVTVVLFVLCPPLTRRRNQLVALFAAPDLVQYPHTPAPHTTEPACFSWQKQRGVALRCAAAVRMMMATPAPVGAQKGQVHSMHSKLRRVACKDRQLVVIVIQNGTAPDLDACRCPLLSITSSSTCR